MSAYLIIYLYSRILVTKGHMEIKQVLTDFGLNEREISVYLAALELGESTVLPISQKAGLKRTYCYDILSDLMDKQLVSYFDKNNRRRYTATDPASLQEVLKTRLHHLQEVLPELRSIYNRSPIKPKISYFEGKEGLISVYEQTNNTKELLAIASPSHIEEHLADYFADHTARLLKRKIKVRELITTEETAPAYLEQYKKPLQEARFLPKEINLTTDMMIFDNKLAMISYEGNLHAVVIESSSIVDTQRALFELLWTQAEKY